MTSLKLLKCLHVNFTLHTAVDYRGSRVPYYDILEDCLAGAHLHLDADFVTVHGMQNSRARVSVNMHIGAVHSLKMAAKIQGAPNVHNFPYFTAVNGPKGVHKWEGVICRGVARMKFAL